MKVPTMPTCNLGPDWMEEQEFNEMTDLLKINVSEHTEKKGGLTYLSWAWAWAEVLKVDPKATWVAHTFGGPTSEEPFMRIGETAMVHTSVTINGLRRDCLLPVMDNRNNAVKNPDARKISDAIMRCMTKAIAMHGLGLYIYAGEDLPEGEADDGSDPALMKQLGDSIKLNEATRTTVMKVRRAIQEHLANEREMGALGEWQGIERLQNHDDVADGVWAGLTTPERNKITELQNAAERMAKASPRSLKEPA